MRKLFAALLLALLFVSIAPAEDKTYSVAGQFSFQYSDGWNKGHRKGGTDNELDWLVSATNPTASFHPVLAHADFSYDDWVRRTINQATPERALASKAEFVTSSGAKGEKLVWNIKTPSGQKLTSYNYMFPGKTNSQLLLSGVVDVDNAAKFGPIYDAFAKSLVIDSGK